MDLLNRSLGRYRIVDELGKGGMGEVYRAHDGELDRDVAIKILPQALAADLKRLARFKREARALAKLSHPNVLDVYDIGSDQGVDFVVMELLEGRTLGDYLREAPLAWPKAIEIALAVAEGLEAAHSREVIHRDLKPENIFVTADGRVKILDFGLARFETTPPKQVESDMVTRDQTATGVVLGTPGYMSPEQVRAQAVDRRTDIFSFGSVLYEMVAGRRAFSGQTAADTMSAILKDEPAEISDLGVAIPEELEQIIRRCLAKDPDGRFQSAADLLAALRAISIDETLPTRPVPRRIPAARKRQRQVIWAAGVVVLAVAIVGVFWWGGFFTRQQRPEPAPPSAKRSIAVLPFKNMTGDSELDVWEAGLAESIARGLAQSEGLQVVGTLVVRDLFETLRGENPELGGSSLASRVAARVGADHLLEGSVLKAGDVIRIEVGLQDAETTAVLTTASADGRSEDDLFSMVEEVVRQVKDFLEIDVLRELNPDMSETAVGTESAAAYRLYIQGLEARAQYDLRSHVEFMERALETDPDFMAAAVWLMFSYRHVGREEDSLRMLEFVESRFDRLSIRDRDRFLGHKAVQIEHDPLKAARIWRRIVERDPLDRDTWNAIGFQYVHTEQYAQAAKAFESFMEADAHWSWRFPAINPYIGLADSYFKLGRYDDSLEVYERGLSLFPEDGWLLRGALMVALKKGDTALAADYESRFRSHLEAEGCGGECMPGHMALVYEEIGEIDRAIEEHRTYLRINRDRTEWRGGVPDRTAATLNLADLLIDHEIDVEEGMGLARGILNAEPDNDRARSLLGWGYHKRGDHDRAIALLQEAWDRRDGYDHSTFIRLDKARAALGNVGQ
jgi:TolB-like protein/tetratricopeptide (TPR) repeat protein/predicted Ser/Thr protein kinase